MVARREQRQLRILNLHDKAKKALGVKGSEDVTRLPTV
jgi:hypothetical protein